MPPRRVPGRGYGTSSAVETATWQRIVESLRAHGVRHLSLLEAPSDAPPLPLPELVDEVLRASDPRLRQSLVPLLLTHPDYGPLVRERIDRLPADLADRAKRLYVVAAAAQRMWRSRLEWILGRQPLLAPAYEEDLQVPDLDQAYGRAAFLAVADDEEARYGYNARAGYEALIDQVLAEMDVGNWGAGDA